MAAWAAADLPVQTSPLISAGRAAGGSGLLDVRQDREFADGHVPGARHLELGSLGEAIGRIGAVDAVMCGHGERAATAASLLERAGQPGVAVAVGGPGEWVAATGRALATG
jgi:hydroxyacylglutathione hydrolase